MIIDDAFVLRRSARTSALPAGTRIVLVAVDEHSEQATYMWGYRALATRTDLHGHRTILVATEVDWHTWLHDPGRDDLQQCPNSGEWPADLVWAA